MYDLFITQLIIRLDDRKWQQPSVQKPDSPDEESQSRHITVYRVTPTGIRNNRNTTVRRPDNEMY